MEAQTKELSKNIFCDLSSSINKIIIELLLCCKYERKLTNNNLSLKQIKQSHVDKNIDILEYPSFYLF